MSTNANPGERTTARDRPFIISHPCNASRELVWKAWTERERLMQWFGPKGFTMPVAKMDFRPGGICHSCVRAPDGREMWGKWVFREIVKPERFVFVHSFSDAAGGVTRHPMSPTWPLEMLSTVTFVEQNGRTLLTVRWLPLNPTDAERKTFDSSHEDMTRGWGGTFEQLADYLANT